MSSDDQVAEITRTLELLLEKDAVYELRALKVLHNGSGRPFTVGGYFDNEQLLAESAAKLSGKADGVYITLNPTRRGLLARAANRIRPIADGDGTKDHEVAYRRLLLIDVDSKRDRGISSTDEEHRAAIERGWKVANWLIEQGWPAPVIGDSGNGGHLVYKINLANTEEAKQLVKRVLEVLAQRFNDDKVTIDTACANASRLSKLYGTLACKGDDIPERPHRRASLLSVPAEWSVVSRELLAKVADEVAADSALPGSPPVEQASGNPELLARLERYQLQVKRLESYRDGHRYILASCPFDSAHCGGTSVAVIQYGNSDIIFKCQHESCRNKKWSDVVRLHEPKAVVNKKNAVPDDSQLSKIVISELPDVRSRAAEKVEFLVPGLLVKDALTLITGPPASGKTTLVLSMANAVASGREIFGGTCEQHPVLYMTREMPIALAADIARRFEIDNGPGTNLFMWGPWSDEVPPKPAATCVLEWVSRTKPLLIFDPVVAFLPPGVSENDSVEIRSFFNQGRTLLRMGAVGVVYLHHTGKSETAQEFRGSSDFVAATDVGYKVTNSGDNVLERLLVKLFRPRFGAAQRSELLLRYTEVNGLASFVADERPEAVRESTTQILKQLLAANPRISRKDFQKAAQLKGRTQAEARQFLDTGVRSKLIQLEIGHHNRHCYSLLEPSARETVQ